MAACVFCGKPALDGHLTCGAASCPEGRARRQQHSQFVQTLKHGRSHATVQPSAQERLREIEESYVESITPEKIKEAQALLQALTTSKPAEVRRDGKRYMLYLLGRLIFTTPHQSVVYCLRDDINYILLTAAHRSVEPTEDEVMDDINGKHDDPAQHAS